MDIVIAGAVCILMFGVLLFVRRRSPTLRRTPLHRVIAIGVVMITPPMLVYALVEHRAEGLGAGRFAELVLLGAAAAFMAAVCVNGLLQRKNEGKERVHQE